MDKTTTKVLIVVAIVVVVLLFVNSKREKFQSEGNANPNGLTYLPKLYEPHLSIITSASEFVGLPDKVLPPWAENQNGYGEAMLLDDGAMGNAGFSYNLCSKSCCSPQWPSSFPMPKDDLVAKSEDKFVLNSYTCNNAWQDSGCLCLTEKQADFLANRGGNMQHH